MAGCKENRIPTVFKSFELFVAFFSNIFNGWYLYRGGRHGRDRMVVGFTTNCAISAYHH